MPFLDRHIPEFREIGATLSEKRAKGCHRSGFFLTATNLCTRIVRMRLCNFVLAACLSVAKAAVIDITTRGAVADSADAGLVNARAIADALEVGTTGP